MTGIQIHPIEKILKQPPSSTNLLLNELWNKFQFIEQVIPQHFVPMNLWKIEHYLRKLAPLRNLMIPQYLNETGTLMP